MMGSLELVLFFQWTKDKIILLFGRLTSLELVFSENNEVGVIFFATDVWVMILALFFGMLIPAQVQLSRRGVLVCNLMIWVPSKAVQRQTHRSSFDEAAPAKKVDSTSKRAYVVPSSPCHL